MSDNKQTGFVKWFDAKKGFSFINIEEHDDIFVHFSNIDMEGFKILDQGDLVEFELKKDPESEKGFEALKVRVLTKDRRY